MSEYTPTTQQVEHAYANDAEAEYRDPVNYSAFVRTNKTEFRRWLAAHDAEVAAKAWAEGHKAGRDYQGDGWNCDVHDPELDNPYRTKEGEKR